MRKLALFAVIFAGVVVVLGAYTRLVDAGLGCPDWPGCYGYLVVPSDAEAIRGAEARYPDAPFEADKAWPEMVHRYFATGIGVIILLLVAAAWRAPAAPAREAGGIRGHVLLLLALVLLQGAFGAWTVTLKLWPQVVTAHLLGGFGVLALLWLLYLRLGPPPQAAWQVPRAVAGHAWWLLAAIVLQVALGGWVSSNYAALACYDFPTCQGAWWPSMDWGKGFDFTQQVGPNYLGGQLGSEARVAIQVGHRLGALVVAGIGFTLVWRLWRAHSRLAWVLGGALGLQIALGVMNVLLALPLAVATAHNAVGALVLLAVVTVNWRALEARARALQQTCPTPNEPVVVGSSK